MQKNRNPLLLLIILVTVFLSFFYGQVLLHPNSFSFSSEGDGMKNYYTYAYYIKNNASHLELEGMNYPYHENFMYTDCHPLEAYTYKAISNVFPSIVDYTIGILNLQMILSIAVTALLLFFILIKLRVNAYLSVLGSIAITALSPQLFRLTGHYALSYSFVVPLTIYLLLLFEEGKKTLRNSILLFFAILFFFFTHAYLGMITAFLVFIYGCIGIINQFLNRKKIASEITERPNYFKLLVSAVLPVLFFYGFVKIIDNHTGRTTNPWGIFENHAELSTVFLPVFKGPLKTAQEFFFEGIAQPWEGFAYIGFTAMIALIFCFCFFIQGSIKAKKIVPCKWIGSRPLTQLIVASIFILLFSMLLPFRSLLYDLIYKVSIIKQFRAIGRFAWVFYFVSNIAAIVMLDKIITSLKERKRKIIAYSIMILFPLFIFSEGVSYHQFISADIKKSPNLFDIHQMPQSFQMDCSALNPNDYQSIISFPFFYIGSENFGKQATNNIYKLSFLFSYHLNLPMMSSFLTRTSIHESKNIMQLFAFNFYDKAIKNDLVSDKPFLLIYSNENLSEEEQNLLNKSKMLIKRDDYSLYELDKNILFKNNAKDEYDVFLKKKDSLFEKNNFLVSDTNLYFSFIDFDKSNAHSFGKENGCYEGLLKDMNVIYSFEGNKLKSDKQYIGRFWMYNDGENEGQDCLNAMIFFDKEKAGKSEWICLANARTTYQINGNWSLAEIQLDNIDKDAVYKLVVKGDDRSKKTIYIDHFLFFEKGMDIYKIEDRVSNQLTLFHNDHQIKVPLVKEQVTAHLIH